MFTPWVCSASTWTFSFVCFWNPLASMSIEYRPGARPSKRYKPSTELWVGLDPRVPLVIPEVNPHAIGPEHRIFPVANCTAIVLCVALAPIERAVGLAAVRVATYQAVSGAGRAGLETLASEEAAGLGKGPQ